MRFAPLVESIATIEFVKPIIALACLVTLPAHASLLTIVNPSFEAEVLADDGFSQAVVGWTEDVNPNSIGTFNPPASAFNAIPDGDNVAILFDSATMSQVLGDTLTGVAGSQYELSVFVGDRGPGFVFSGYDIQLFAGATLLASVGSTASGGFPAGPTPQNGEFVDVDLSYVTTGLESVIGEALRIQISNRFVGGTSETSFDNVRLDFTQGGPQPPTTVSEPATLALLGLSVVGLGYARRRKA